jgi:hypothetical protein
MQHMRGLLAGAVQLHNISVTLSKKMKAIRTYRQSHRPETVSSIDVRSEPGREQGRRCGSCQCIHRRW